MKRLGSSDSLGGLISICPSSDQHSPRNNSNHVYSREFQSMLDGLDEEGCVEESGHVAEKKRRLSVDQVKALEKNFEVENKLEPERKVKLAQELGLQPRQVAVWFQNRRARWKTKQLERDYGVLKANFDSLKHNFDSIKLDNEALLKEIRELKSKLGEEGKTESDVSVKEEIMVVDSENQNQQISADDQDQPVATSFLSSETKDLNFESFKFNNGGAATSSSDLAGEISVFPDFKDGSSDSDSSAILNEDYNSPTTAAISSSGLLQSSHLLLSPSSSPPQSAAGAGIDNFQFQKMYQTQFVKLEEHNFFSDEACNFFSDEQPPSLQQWYCAEPWTSS